LLLLDLVFLNTKHTKLFKIRQARHKQVPSHNEVATEWASTHEMVQRRNANQAIPASKHVRIQ